MIDVNSSAPTPGTRDLSIPADESVYCELIETDENYAQLRPYTNENPERETYTEWTSRGNDVTAVTPASDSYENATSLVVKPDPDN